MNGNRYLLDTNAIIALLNGNQELLQLLQTAEWVAISIINQLEFLAFTGLTERDRQIFQQFLQRVEVISLRADQTEMIEQIIQLRMQYRLSLPDAIIAGTAIYSAGTLITADQQLHHIPGLSCLSFIP